MCCCCPIVDEPLCTARQAFRSSERSKRASAMRRWAAGWRPHVQPLVGPAPARCTPLAARQTAPLWPLLAQAGRRHSSCWRRQLPATAEPTFLPNCHHYHRCRHCRWFRCQQSCTTRGSSEGWRLPAAATPAAPTAAAAQVPRECQRQQAGWLMCRPGAGCCSAAAARRQGVLAGRPGVLSRCTALLRQTRRQ